jgi:ankyrin repeat protein
MRAKSGNGLSSLSHAVRQGDKELVSVLLAHGADPLLKSADGRTALERAEANGATEIVALLKQAKADESDYSALAPVSRTILAHFATSSRT